MKRSLIALTISLISMPVFAYYGSYYSSSYYEKDDDLETYGIVMIIILIIWSILNLILFFKIWKMTNNVELITQKICGHSNKEGTIKEDILRLHLEEKDNEAYAVLNSYMVNKTNEIVSDIKLRSYLPSDSTSAEPKVSDFYADGLPVEECFKGKMNELMQELIPLYIAINRDMPPHFETLTLTELLKFGE